MKSVFQTRSTPACVGKAATVFWNRNDRYPELRTAQPEHRQSARVWLRPPGAASPGAESAHRRECRPQEKCRRCVRFLVGRLQCELFLNQRGPALPGTRQLSAEKNRAQV